MHQGTFPRLEFPLTQASGSEAYVPGSWGSEQLESIRPGMSTRRQWLAGMGGLLAGVSLTIGWSNLAPTSSATRPGEGAAAAVQPGTPEWALQLIDAPADEVLQWSGDLERVVARHSEDQRLVPCCERVLEVVLDERGTTATAEIVDVAGASAVRALSRLGRSDLVTMHSRRILSRRELPQTRAATERLLVDRRPPEARK